MPYPDRMRVEQLPSNIGEDHISYRVRDETNGRCLDVSISETALYTAVNRQEYIDQYISDAMQRLAHERTNPPSTDFCYQYTDTMITNEDVLNMKPIKLRKTKQPPIKRNLPQ